MLDTVGNAILTAAAQPIQAPDKRRVLLLAFRQSLLIALGAVEDYTGVERSVQPKHKR